MSYDLQDPYDISMLENEFSMITVEQWEEYMAFASQGDNWKRFDKKAIYIGLKNAEKTYGVTHKQMLWAVNVANAIEKERERLRISENLDQQIQKEQFNQPLRHFTLRVAWHDNEWNGTICKDPAGNRYCNAYHSLLSERLRIDKEKNMQNELDNAKRKLSEIDYVPPCYWSVNINSDQPIEVLHYNPAAKELNKIPETLQDHSMFSWPFAISFNRTKKQIDLEGAYPPNLDNVRIPLFREKIKSKKSIAFIYANYSNPFTEEERQYLVIGAALVNDKGDLHKFTPFEKIQKKREKFQKNKNFPVINWALQYSFNKSSMVIMPYHAYIEKSKTVSDSEKKQEWLDKIKVAVNEPELIHCFKYVAMDIDDDEAIYILSKMRQKLVDCQRDGVIAPEEMTRRIGQVDELSKHCWEERGYFPSFRKLAEIILQKEKGFENFWESIKELQPDEQPEKIQALLDNPTSDVAYRIFKGDLFDLKERLEARGISHEQFIQLSMLNLSRHQLERVLDGRITGFINQYGKMEGSTYRTPLEDVCNNPYLLVEEYLSHENLQDDVTGEEIDLPIELFKIDIAYFPDSRVKERLDIQRQITIADKRRLRCVIINHLNSLEQSGDCFEEATELENALKKYPLFYQQGELALATDILKKQIADRDAFLQENNRKLKIVDANDTRYYYLDKIYEAEKKIGDKVLELLQQPKNERQYQDLTTYIYKCISELKPKLKDTFNEEDFRTDREQLYKNIFSEKIFVLAGGPGSGKSHELLNILIELKSQGENYLLLTPTGKAALRLKTDPMLRARGAEIEASTIAKWISEVDNQRFLKDKISRVNNLVIDEMSMVSLLTFLEILEKFHFSNPSFKRLILVGDPNQLPAIGYGKVLKDILYYLKSDTAHNVNFIELVGNLRSELSKNKVIKLSEAFEEKGELEEELEDIFNASTGDRMVSDGFKICYWKDEKELKQKIEIEFDIFCTSQSIAGSRQEKLHLVLGLNKNGSVNKSKNPTLDNFQLLTPYLSGLSGADGLNDFFQRQFKNEFELELAKGFFKESDKIIRTKNYYQENELLISNGSIGIIRETGKEVLQFQEDGYKEINLKDIRKNEREFFELAYAISVHKSQGSGFDHLFIIIPNRPGLLSRELVYTALTRCRKSITLFIQTSEEKNNRKSILEFARNRTFTDSRKTSLLLDQPFRYFSLEPEKGVYVQSRTELMIYHALKHKREELGNSNFDFYYERYPNDAVKIKTDFTIISKGKTWYWEHLGRLGNRVYERTWKTLKRPTYKANSLENDLLTTDELRGLSPNKIEDIIKLISDNNVETEDKTNKYSLHHYSLR